jgi:uncharacterized protein (DUF697 family)
MPVATRKALTWAAWNAPVIWLLGKTQAGKSSIVAEITGQARDQIGSGFEALTKEARIYAFPEDRPVLRFLDTRGLGDDQSYDPTTDVASAEGQANLIMAVVRADDLALDEVTTVLRTACRSRPDWPVIVVQTMLHNCYPRNSQHRLPYPYNGTDEDFKPDHAPNLLADALRQQRLTFADVPCRLPVIFVPVDFTSPDMGLPPTDYGAEHLWAALQKLLPEASDAIQHVTSHDLDTRIRRTVILPWSLAAAATNAVPAPILGGVGSAGMQAVMVRTIARRYGISVSVEHWREFVAALGTGLVVGFGTSWLSQQVLKLGLGVGTIAVASWTFATTWGLGEAALYHFGEKARGRTPDPDQMRQRYEAAVSRAKADYDARKRGGS